MEHYAALIMEQLGIDVKFMPGGGAEADSVRVSGCF